MPPCGSTHPADRCRRCSPSATSCGSCPAMSAPWPSGWPAVPEQHPGSDQDRRRLPPPAGSKVSVGKQPEQYRQQHQQHRPGRIEHGQPAQLRRLAVHLVVASGQVPRWHSKEEPEPEQDPSDGISRSPGGQYRAHHNAGHDDGRAADDGACRPAGGKAQKQVGKPEPTAAMPRAAAATVATRGARTVLTERFPLSADQTGQLLP